MFALSYAFRAGLELNAVRVFESTCLCLVFCSVFESERVRLNVLGLSEHLFGNIQFAFECVAVATASEHLFGLRGHTPPEHVR